MFNQIHTPTTTSLLLLDRHTLEAVRRLRSQKIQLLYLSSLSFTWTEIASLLGVSRMTIYRRRCNFNMLGLARNTVTDAQLGTMIHEWKSEMPAIGETLVVGRLHASGVFVTRERVRCAIRAVDPLNMALQAPRGLTRRQAYSVPAPNSLWHIGERRNCGVFVCVVWGGGGRRDNCPRLVTSSCSPLKVALIQPSTCLLFTPSLLSVCVTVLRIHAESAQSTCSLY